jgi:hypothetical protein
VLLVFGGLSKGTVQEMVMCLYYFLTCWIFAVAKQLQMAVVAVEMMTAAACCTHPVTPSPQQNVGTKINNMENCSSKVIQ